MLRDKLSRRPYGVAAARTPGSPTSAPAHPPGRPTSPLSFRSGRLGAAAPGRPAGNASGRPGGYIPGRPSGRLAAGARLRGRTRRVAAARSMCAPLTTADELLSWRPTASAARCVSRVPLPDSAVARYMRSSRGGSVTNSISSKRIQPPRLLVCHDFKGGYSPAEASSDGVSGAECPEEGNLWKFNHWAYVDVFVYFSHHRVTIPPVGYIHAAHRHGALALGTLIFEWDEGAADLIKMMSSYSVRAKAAQQLATIAKFFGFDGWLVNVEVALEGGATSASDLSAFVADLTRACRKALGPASEVVWYDAVTRNGELKWQNELNDENDGFFKAAGALFTNYHWTRNAPVRSAVKAGPRRTDVFTGIDVYGRKTFGGGGFQTHIALRAIKQAGTSAAIFAPGWTVEQCAPDAELAEVEERFWTGPRGRFGRECVAQYFKERAVLTQLPFATFFDPGWGPCTVTAGNVVSEDRYFNMSRQDVQPSFLRTRPASGDGAAATLSLSHEQALNGSASIRLTFSFSGSRMLSGTYTVLRLFVANVLFPKTQVRNLPQGFQSPEYLRISYQYYVDDTQALKPRSSFSRTRTNKLADGATGLDEEPEEDSAVAASRAAGANQFGLLLLFAAPARAVLLVGEKSRWLSGHEPGSQRSAPRLEILEKYVDYTAIAPSREEAVRGAPLRNDGAPSWMSRTFEIPSSFTSGQRLQEVMVIVGEPPLQPISIRPSPLMTPSSQSRQLSFRGSRVPSKVVSPRQQRPEAEPFGRQSSFRSNRGPRTRIGAELLSAGILGEDDEGSGSRRESFHKLLDGPNGGRKFASRSGSGLTEDDFDTGSDYGSETSDRESFKSFNSRSSRSTHRPSSRFSRQNSMTMGNRATRMEELDYSSNFDVEGSVDFSEMQGDILKTSASRAISRLGSRLGTPDSNRLSRLQRMDSLRGSRYGSVSSSRLGSRNPSRVVSPSETPIGGGGGAHVLRTHSARGSVSVSSQLGTEDRRYGRSESFRGSGTSSSALADLKSALMNAADSMATGDKSAAQFGVSRRARGSQGGGIQRVFLGGLALEIIDASQS